MSAGGAPKYEVDASGVVRRALKRLQEQATLEGRGEAFVAALHHAWTRLHDDPLEFGEPLYRLPYLRIQVRQAALRPLVIDYGVYEDQPLVFIQSVKLLTLATR